jgi:PTS system mannose-specific IIB component
MGKTYVRIDDRLIHGQTVLAWCPTLSIAEIIAVDDVSAKNPMLKTIMTMGVPSKYKTNIVTLEEAKALLQAEQPHNRLLIVKVPSVLKALENQLGGIEQIILGNLAKREDTLHKVSGATGIFYLSNDDVEFLDRLHQEGQKISFHQLPSTQETTGTSFMRTIK